MQSMGDAIQSGTYAGIQLLRPFIGLNKSDIARCGSSLGIDFRETWSCYKGGHTHCGVCGTACGASESCVGGKCVPGTTAGCPEGQVLCGNGCRNGLPTADGGIVASVGIDYATWDKDASAFAHRKDLAAKVSIVAE